MAKKANYRSIGVFVVGAVILLIGSIVVFGGGKFFEDTLPAVIYFDESVKGLSVGAPVSYRGVSVGEVTSIGLVYQEKGDKLYTPVRINLVNSRAESLGKQDELQPSRADKINFYKRMIKKGLRARLAMDSLVTGQLYIDLEFKPDTPIKLTDLDHGELELPTSESGLEKLIGTIKKLPIDQIANQLNSVITRLDEILSKGETEQIVTNLNALLSDSRNSLNNVSGKLDRVLETADKRLNDPELAVLAKNLNLFLEEGRGNMKNVSADASASLKQATETLNSLDNVVNKDSLVYNRIVTALEEIEKAAKSVQLFTDYLEQHPEAIIRGKK